MRAAGGPATLTPDELARLREQFVEIAPIIGDCFRSLAAALKQIGELVKRARAEYVGSVDHVLDLGCDRAVAFLRAGDRAAALRAIEVSGAYAALVLDGGEES